MRSATNQSRYRQRSRLLQSARELARSGQHRDHTTILPLLEGLDGFADARLRLEERGVRAQLDRLCAAALTPSSPKINLDEMRRSRISSPSRRR